MARYDVVYICGVGNTPLSFLPRLTGVPTVFNVDGADWQCNEWGGFARRYLRWSERAATRLPTCIIADSRVVERYYLITHSAPSVFIPYGSEVTRRPPGETLRRLGLQPDRYLFWVVRLVPENNAHHTVAAYQAVGEPATGMQLCIVGDAPYSTDYITPLNADVGPGVVFAGYVFGDGSYELGSNAHSQLFTSGVGGTQPALLLAMGLGNCILVNDIEANADMVGDAGTLYDRRDAPASLAQALRRVLGDSDTWSDMRRRAGERAQRVYSWDSVTDAYEALFARLSRR